VRREIDHGNAFFVIHHWGSFADCDGLVTVHSNDESGAHGTTFAEGIHVSVVHHVEGSIHEDTNFFAVFGVRGVLEIEKFFFKIMNYAMSLTRGERERDRREREAEMQREMVRGNVREEKEVVEKGIEGGGTFVSCDSKSLRLRR
jgi:hypothetical protein